MIVDDDLVEGDEDFEKAKLQEVTEEEDQVDGEKEDGEKEEMETAEGVGSSSPDMRRRRTRKAD